MGYHNRIETDEYINFLTTRTRNSELWFANNPAVEEFALALLAKVSNRRGVDLYAFGLEGSHYHSLAEFPLNNRGDFCRDFNSGLAKAVASLTPEYPGGRFWERRYSNEFIANDSSIVRKFFYTVLQPVGDGLVDTLREWPFYNCFHDAVCGIQRKIRVINQARYRAAKRYNKHVRAIDFEEEYILSYKRLPGFEHLSQKEYRKVMEQKLEAYRQEIIAERIRQGKPAVVGRAALLQVVPGTPARNPKKSNRNSHRPRFFADCEETREVMKAWYFNLYFSYREISKRFRAGEIDVEFPPGTYRPHSRPTVKPSGPYSPL